MKIRPFNSGSEFGDWHLENCQRCTKHCWDINKTCKYDSELNEALIYDGKISHRSARAIGAYDSKAWKCKLFKKKEVNNNDLPQI